MSRYETHPKGQGLSSEKNSKDFYTILEVIQKRTCNLNKLHLQRNALNRGCIVKVHLVAALRRPKFTSFKFLCICLHQKKKKRRRRIQTTCCTCLIPSDVPFFACLPNFCRHARPSTCWAGHGCLPSTQRAPGGQGPQLRIPACERKGLCATSSRHPGDAVWMLQCWDLCWNLQDILTIYENNRTMDLKWETQQRIWDEHRFSEPFLRLC